MGYTRYKFARPLNNALFCPIAAEYENDNPRNIQYIPPVIIFIFLALKQNSTLFKGLKGVSQGKFFWYLTPGPWMQGTWY